MISLVSDHPALRDLTEFVVPQWYLLVQNGIYGCLIHKIIEGLHHKMKMEVNKPLEKQCREVFCYWL